MKTARPDAGNPNKLAFKQNAAIGNSYSHAERNILRVDLVCKRTGWCRSTLYNRIKSGDFPLPVRTGPRTVGWLPEDVDRYIDSKVDERDIRTEAHSTNNI